MKRGTYKPKYTPTPTVNFAPALVWYGDELAIYARPGGLRVTTARVVTMRWCKYTGWRYGLAVGNHFTVFTQAEMKQRLVEIRSAPLRVIVGALAETIAAA